MQCLLIYVSLDFRTSLSLLLVYTSRYKPWEALWGSLSTPPLVDFRHRLTACPSYAKSGAGAKLRHQLCLCLFFSGKYSFYSIITIAVLIHAVIINFLQLPITAFYSFFLRKYVSRIIFEISNRTAK